MPYELESVIPGHMAWPHGFTIGPSEELAGLSRQAKEQRLAEWLPTFDKLGWMASGELKNSQAALGSSGLTGLDAFLNGELTSGRVADEVVAIVKGMLR
jgi:hypothetical protein